MALRFAFFRLHFIFEVLSFLWVLFFVSGPCALSSYPSAIRHPIISGANGRKNGGWLI
jgi:hypothetical protein